MSLEPYKQIIVKLAIIYDYGDRLSGASLKVMCELLRKMCPNPKEAERAAEKYVEDAEHTRFPIPIHKILHSLRPPVTQREQATVLAARIWGSISKFGYTNPLLAYKHIGLVGWEVVKQRGGWLSLCQESNTAQPGTMQAQLRDLIEGMLKRDRAGMSDISQIEFNHASKKLVDRLNVSMKSLPGGEKCTQSSK